MSLLKPSKQAFDQSLLVPVLPAKSLRPRLATAAPVPNCTTLCSMLVMSQAFCGVIACGANCGICGGTSFAAPVLLAAAGAGTEVAAVVSTLQLSQATWGSAANSRCPEPS